MKKYEVDLQIPSLTVSITGNSPFPRKNLKNRQNGYINWHDPA